MTAFVLQSAQVALNRHRVVFASWLAGLAAMAVVFVLPLSPLGAAAWAGILGPLVVTVIAAADVMFVTRSPRTVSAAAAGDAEGVPAPVGAAPAGDAAGFRAELARRGRSAPMSAMPWRDGPRHPDPGMEPDRLPGFTHRDQPTTDAPGRGVARQHSGQRPHRHHSGSGSA